MVQVRDPSHSMCNKIMWELYFHNYMFILKLYTKLHVIFWGSAFYFEICDIDKGRR